MVLAPVGSLDSTRGRAAAQQASTSCCKSVHLYTQCIVYNPQMHWPSTATAPCCKYALAAFRPYGGCCQGRLVKICGDPGLCECAPHNQPPQSHLGEAGLLPTEVMSLMELGTIFELLDPQQEPVLIMGDMPTQLCSPSPWKTSSLT